MDDPHRSDGSTAATDCDRGSVYDTHTELSVLHHGDTGPGSTLRKLRRRPPVLSKVPSEHGMTSKQKFVGFARGGMKTQYRCMGCMRVLDGPRF